MTEIYYADQHIHTDFSGDSDTPPEEQIEKALSLGMKRICFTDHHDYDVVSDVDFNLDIPRYLTETTRLKEKYADRIEICTGIELGLQNHIADYLEKLTKEYSFDFIIGSIHYVDGLDPYFPEFFEKNTESAYERYFDVTLKRIRNIKCYDSLGHLDYIVRYGKKHGLTYSYKQYADRIDLILKQIIADGKALECNSGGLSRGLDEPNPGAEVFKRYKELGGELVTLGSDAHSPDTLGCKFEQCGEMLKSCGFKYYAVYKNRKPVMEKL
ncbi:MAG: histidinol-phosphatase HisJ family protein [Oscillospiraceae bacterium]